MPTDEYWLHLKDQAKKKIKLLHPLLPEEGDSFSLRNGMHLKCTYLNHRAGK